MPGQKVLILGDSHGSLPDFSYLHEHYRGKIDLAIHLGDLVDVCGRYSDRQIFLKALSDEIEKLKPSTFVIVPGNHDDKCDKFERRYMHFSNGRFERRREKLKGQIRETKEKSFINGLDTHPSKIKPTIDTLQEIGVMADYTFISESGRTLSVDGPWEDFTEWGWFENLGDEQYDMYITWSKEGLEENHTPPEEIGPPRRTYLLSHHNCTQSFNPRYSGYYHGHSHHVYKNGEKISTGYFIRKNKRWVFMKSFDYVFDNQKIKEVEDSREYKRNTPGIYFFLNRTGDKSRRNRRYQKARLEIMPGIEQDWMLLDHEKQSIIYSSTEKTEVHTISIPNLFAKLCGKIGEHSNQYSLVI
ncbi:MAG: hypothetical protein GOV01_01295 [Candidatus Altiarchaeota archaeon]|nr:hypothetical protein [Candidatus Altiarchaeota archaeon]